MLAVTYAEYFTYIVVRKLCSGVQGLLWLMNGTLFDMYCHQLEDSNHTKAQVLDIVHRHKLDLVLEPSGPGNFITTHNSFVSPSYVLRDNVTLYNVTAKEAVFVETPVNIDVSHSDSGSFIRVAQFEKARRIIKVPIAAFHKLAEEIGDPKGEIVFLTNTSRCGSTLLTQIFEETGCCMAFSEPDALNAIATYKGKMPQEELDTLIRNCIRMQCKPFRNRSIKAYILKLTAPTIDAVPMFIRLYPNSKQIFMYREGLKVAQSLIRAASGMPLLALTLIIGRLHPRFLEMGVSTMGVPARDFRKFKFKLTTPMIGLVFAWAMFCKKYLDYREQGINIVAVKYEDLVKHPRESTQAIFRYCNLPDDLVEPSIKALARDSQRCSPINGNTIMKVNAPGVQGYQQDDINSICDTMGLPRVPEPCNLEGTITTFKGKEDNGTTQ